MFGKVIVFRLFEMIQKRKKEKKRARTASSGPGSASGSGRVRRYRPSNHVCGHAPHKETLHLQHSPLNDHNKEYDSLKPY